ncbi:MAG: dihydrofolate reductase [Erythrobacter sp.]
MTPEIVLIYARAANGAIGKDGDLPWRLPADLKHFKALTMGLPMIMGRKTFDSLPGLLPGRRHIVLTRDAGWQADGAETAATLDDALALAGGGTIAIIGGAAVFEAFLTRADRVELTQIHADYEGDTFMPPLGADWHETAREDHAAAGANPAFSFLTYRKALA